MSASDETAVPVNSTVPRGLDALFNWMRRQERSVLLAGVGLQLIVLLSMGVGRAMPLLTGQTVLIRVIPVDPRDLFRGDYVILSYELSRFPVSGIQGAPANWQADPRSWEGRTIYASLVPEPDGVHWKMSEVSLTRPATGLFLKGQIAGWGRLKFGIESYFVQEGTGKKYEEAVRSGKLSAEVAVAPDGQATLKGLRIEP